MATALTKPLPSFSIIRGAPIRQVEIWLYGTLAEVRQ